MKCCEKEMHNNEDNYHCNICGKRVYRLKKPKICPECGTVLYDNGITCIVLNVDSENIFKFYLATSDYWWCFCIYHI